MGIQNRVLDVGNLQLNSFASVTGGVMHASTSMHGQLNHGYFVIADAQAKYYDQLRLRNGSGASKVRFSYSVHGTMTGAIGPGYVFNTGYCPGSTDQAAGFGFTVYTSLNPDGSPASGRGMGGSCLVGDGSTVHGFLDVPIASFTGGVLPFEATLLAYGRIVSNNPGVAVANVNFDNDFSQTAGLTGVAIFDALGADITSQYDVSFAGPGIATTPVTATPEPATLALTATGMLGLLIARRRRCL